MTRATINRAWATLYATATLGIILTTSLNLDVWFIHGLTAELFGLAYVTAVYAIVADPRNPWPHRIAMPMGILFWGGRAAAALQVAFTAPDPPPAIWTVPAGALGFAATTSALHLLAVRGLAAEHAAGIR